MLPPLVELMIGVLRRVENPLPRRPESGPEKLLDALNERSVWHRNQPERHFDQRREDPSRAEAWSWSALGRFEAGLTSPAGNSGARPVVFTSGPRGPTSGSRDPETSDGGGVLDPSSFGEVEDGLRMASADEPAAVPVGSQGLEPNSPCWSTAESTRATGMFTPGVTLLPWMLLQLLFAGHRSQRHQLQLGERIGYRMHRCGRP